MAANHPRLPTLLKLLLGGLPEEKAALARLANPVAHLDANDPPVLLIHGDADPQMPFEQSQEFEKACVAAGVPASLHTIVGGKHAGAESFTTRHACSWFATFCKNTSPPEPVQPKSWFGVRASV